MDWANTASQYWQAYIFPGNTRGPSEPTVDVQAFIKHDHALRHTAGKDSLGGDRETPGMRKALGARSGPSDQMAPHQRS